jgi:hypothetical protein
VVLLAYVPSHMPSLWASDPPLADITQFSLHWPFKVYRLISLVLVPVALLLAVLGPRVVKELPLFVVRLFLVINWLPHSYCALVMVPWLTDFRP